MEGSARPNLDAFEQSRSVRISDMGPDTVVNIYTPRAAAGAGGAAAGAGGAAAGADEAINGTFGIMEIIMHFADRGLTLSFYHKFN